ncbi:hypothetical protein D9619_012029 [Psilocybe cf. subviscida]|uniref:ER transporter 6TM N-terminal domain-containing protein n=1 Tax=Psilocybe cf. subviscida TaxID=2480587 RepID=A0A8H5B8A8_9AGAR|nr:hypothetical protein D9619_012029 [Psilocybe cf. subviscida]
MESIGASVDDKKRANQTNITANKTAAMEPLREKSTTLPLDSQPSSSTPPSPPSLPSRTPTSSTNASTDTSASCASSPEASKAKTKAKVNSEPKPKPKWLTFLTSRVVWIPANWTFAKWKPAIRCALVAWLSLVLFVIPVVERELGQASFLVLIVAFLSPPSDPFLMMLERELLIIFFVCLAWAWTSLGIFLADLTRNFRDPNATFLDAATGQYIEAAPCVIMGIFIFFGTAFFLFIRARKGPGPYLFPTVLGCICLDISLTTACIFPYPYYLSGRAVVLPLTLHTAISILLSLIVFPSTISALFTTRLGAVLAPLESMLEKNRDLLAVGPYDDTPAALGQKAQTEKEKNVDAPSNSDSSESTTGAAKKRINAGAATDEADAKSAPLPAYATTLASTRALTRAGEAALGPLAAVGRLLHSDLIYGRFAPSDFDAFHKLFRRLVGRADGLGIYFGLVEAGLSTSADGGPASPGEMTPVVGGGDGMGSGGGGMVVGAGGKGGVGLGITPGPVGPKYGRVDSLPASLHGNGTATPRTPVHHHHHHFGHMPKDAHSQLHFASLSHTYSAPNVPGLRSSASSVRGAAGGRSGTATPTVIPLQAIPPHVKDVSSTSHHASPESDPKSHLHRAHALHLHHSLSSLARTLSHATTGHKHDHEDDHEHDHKHDHIRTPRPFSKKAEWAVGTFESQRYMNLEATRLHDPRAEEWTRVTFGLLRESCTPFLGLCALGLRTTKSWLASDVRSGRLKHFLGIKREEEQKRLKARRKEIEEVRDKLKEGLRIFREQERHLVLDPYLQAFEHSVAPSAAATPHVSPPGSPLRANHSRPHMRGGTSSNGADDVGETTPMIDTVMDDIATAHHDGVSPERRRASQNESPTDTVENMFGLQSPDLEDGEQDGDNDAGAEKRQANHKRTHSYGYGVAVGESSTPGLRDHRSPQMPPHRYLFNCYVYQYNLIQIGSIIIEMLDEILRLETERPEPKLWTPVTHLFSWTPWFLADSPSPEQVSDDDDPDVIQGFPQKELEQAAGVGPDATDDPTDSNTAARKFKMSTSTWYEPESESTDLGLPRRRDPDSLPPRNMVEWFFYQISRLVIGLGGGNSVYAFKAGVLTVLLCLPSFLKSSAAFALQNRFSWGIFMGQLSLARFRGDTTFSLIARVSSTFFGGVTGMVMWYISAGGGNGSPYGLAATCLVCFPLFFFARLYWPVNPMMNIVFFVTAVLVIGYSYQDQHVVTPGAPGTGFSVFWKRVLLVSAGVFAAFIASFLPPSTTIRRYQRSLLATTSAEMGTIYCAILSFANTKHEEEIQDIIVSLIALRSKLARSNALRTNVGYEFSLRGRWPSERYQAVADLQMALAYSLSHLMSVLEHLEPSWSRAFLRRTRFLDPDFQGDILAVVSMISNSLRNGTPLPQITPCPLLDRFTHKYHGLDVIHKDSEEDYGLPRNLSVETLRNEQYLMFCVGISIAYGIINRLDKLMLAVKEIVGEQYHIHGVGLRSYQKAHPPSGYEQGNGRVRFTRGPGVHHVQTENF